MNHMLAFQMHCISGLLWDVDEARTSGRRKLDRRLLLVGVGEAHGAQFAVQSLAADARGQAACSAGCEVEGPGIGGICLELCVSSLCLLPVVPEGLGPCGGHGWGRSWLATCSHRATSCEDE